MVARNWFLVNRGRKVNDGVHNFENLHAWQESQKFAVEIYTITQSFPATEQYGLTSQIRRAVVSISANIAEGSGRKTIKDQQHFYTIAYGSLLEVKNYLYLACSLGYITEETKNELLERSIQCQKLINGLKRWLAKI